jgi:hypothetical protein
MQLKQNKVSNKKLIIMANFFQKKGLLPVALPRKSIKHLQILLKTKNGEGQIKGQIIGGIEDIFVDSSITIPLGNLNEPIIDFSVNDEVELDGEVGMSVLEGMSEKLGKATVGAGYKKIDKITLSFKNILRDSIKETYVKDYLKTSVLNMNKDASYQSALEKGDLYVITEVYKTNNVKISITNEQSSNANLDIDVNSILNTTGEIKKHHKGSESLKNNKGYVVFAVRVRRITYKKSYWEQKPKIDLVDPDITEVLDAELGDVIKTEFPENKGIIDLD